MDNLVKRFKWPDAAAIREAAQTVWNATPRTSPVLIDDRPDAAAIREAARALLAWRDAELQEAINSGNELTLVKMKIEDASAFLARALALIDKPGKDTISTLYGALAQGQEPLGADFEAVWDANVDILYDNSPTGKEVMPSAPVDGQADTAPAGLSAGGRAGPFRRDPCDWTEDYARENGNYLCECVQCGNQFFGHKRRVTCKTCAGLSAGGGAGWQPIETAPRDGTDFLGYWVGRFGPRHENSCEIRTRHNLYEWESVFLEASKDFRPTHWMPLPAPPATKGGE